MADHDGITRTRDGFIVGPPSGRGVPGPGMRERLGGLWRAARNPEAPANRMAKRFGNLLDRLSDEVDPALTLPLGKAGFGVFSGSSDASAAQERVRDHLGKHNMIKLKGAHRHRMNVALDHIGNLANLDRLLTANRGSDDIEAIQRIAMRDPEHAARQLANWYGRQGAVQSHHHDEAHEQAYGRVRGF